MPSSRFRLFIRRFVGRRLAGCLVAGFVLLALQPFIAVHFRDDGWEDEPGFRIRAVSATAQFEPDERADHSNSLETTIYVPSGASIDSPSSMQHGLDGLMALVLALLPLSVGLRALVIPAAAQGPERLHSVIRAPPLARPWRRRPPETAPPSAT